MATALNNRSQRWVSKAISTPFIALVGWYRVSLERAELRKLSADRLSDIGLTQREVDWELSRPFWQAKRDD